LAPWETLTLPRAAREGSAGALAGTAFPAPEPARGAVVFLHPWLEWGQAYFHRRGRIEAVRGAGYHAVTMALPGFGASGPRRGFPDLDIQAALEALAARWPGLPLFVWGVSAGGYWAHPVLARAATTLGVRAAIFEDVSPHLIEWSRRTTPWGRPAFAFFEAAFAVSYRFLDLRRHAPFLGLPAVAYVSGGADAGVLPAETAALAGLAGGTSRVVPKAGHLAAIRSAGAEICDLALETFARGAGPRLERSRRGENPV
jgi:pimeloyl-ACP methyl ester carboxylesterase